MLLIWIRQVSFKSVLCEVCESPIQNFQAACCAATCLWVLNVDTARLADKTDSRFELWWDNGEKEMTNSRIWVTVNGLTSRNDKVMMISRSLRASLQSNCAFANCWLWLWFVSLVKQFRLLYTKLWVQSILPINVRDSGLRVPLCSAYLPSHLATFD